MAIRWFSTPESRANDEPSVLAIGETVGAILLSVWIAICWHTYVHIAVGAVAAPFLLMQSEFSKSRAALLMNAYAQLGGWNRFVLHAVVAGVGSWIAWVLEGNVWAWVVVVGAGTVIPTIRAGSVAWSLITHPIATLCAMPGNWRHSALVLDSAKWPELLPTSEDQPGDVYVAFAASRKTLVSDLRRSFQDSPQWVRPFVILVPLMIAPAFLYRWSLKSTAIIWFPLLWSLRSVRSASAPLRSFFTIYVSDPVSKIVIGVSIISLLAFATKIVLWNEWNGFVAWWDGSPLRQTLSLYVAPAEIQKWQWAVAINSVIAIVMYVLAGHWLVRIQHDHVKSEIGPRRVFQVGLFIRKLMTCYTIACTLYITIRAASEWSLPPLGDKWFPW